MIMTSSQVESKTSKCCGFILTNIGHIVLITVCIFFYFSNCDGSSSRGSIKRAVCDVVDASVAGLDDIIPVRTMILLALLAFFILTLIIFIFRIKRWKAHAENVREAYEDMYKPKKPDADIQDLKNQFEDFKRISTESMQLLLQQNGMQQIEYPRTTTNFQRPIQDIPNRQFSSDTNALKPPPLPRKPNNY